MCVGTCQVRREGWLGSVIAQPCAAVGACAGGHVACRGESDFDDLQGGCVVAATTPAIPLRLSFLLLFLPWKPRTEG